MHQASSKQSRWRTSVNSPTAASQTHCSVFRASTLTVTCCRNSAAATESPFADWGPDYGSTTINGRDALELRTFSGASGRHFDFASVPPDILSGVTVYKTSTSELIEPGMAGQVNLKNAKAARLR